MEGVLMLMKKSPKKPERLTAAQARAIPIDNSFVEDGLQSIYKAIRETARQGGSEILWRHSTFSDGVKEVIMQRLKDDGYHVVDTKSYFVWKIVWKELW
jgi:hypothetical protein